MAFCNQDAGPPHRTGATGRLARSIKVVSLLVEAAPMHKGAIVNLDGKAHQSPQRTHRRNVSVYRGRSVCQWSSVSSRLTLLPSGLMNEITFARGPSYFNFLVAASGFVEPTSSTGSQSQSSHRGSAQVHRFLTLILRLPC